jgi:hypothetical protein
MKRNVCGGADRQQALERRVAALFRLRHRQTQLPGDREMTARVKIATKCSLFHMEQSQEE